MKKVEELEKRLDRVENVAHVPKDFKCNYPKNKGEK